MALGLVLTRSFLDSTAAVRLLALGIVAGIVAAYANTWRVPMLLDDEATILQNPTVVVLADSWKPPLKSGLTSGGRPLVNMSLALNYRWARDDVVPYHLTNVALHALAALVLFGLVRRTLLLEATVRADQDLPPTLVAGFAAGLWALHPLQTESVTYIVQRAESIAGLCILLSLYCFSRFARDGGKAWLVAVWFSSLAGMASKEVCAAIPLLVFVYDRTFVAGTFAAAWAKRRWLYMALASTWVLLGMLVLGGGGRDGTVGFSGDIGWWPYLQTQAWGIVRYVRLSIWPAGLVFDYGVFVESDLLVVGACGALVVFLIAVSVVALRRWPGFGFLGFLFFAVLAPTSSFVPVVTQTLAEHRMYLPLAAVVVLFVTLLVRWAGARAVPVLLAAALALGFATYQRNEVYSTDIGLWNDSLAKRPKNARALLNLGLAHHRQGRPDEALAHLRRAQDLSPEDATIAAAMGQVLHAAGRIEESLAELRRGYELDPRSWYVRLNLGNALLAAGDVDAAIAELGYARERQPYHPDIEFNLANALAAAGRVDEACIHFEEALRRDPNDLEARVNFAVMLRDAGRLDEALRQFGEGLRRQPDAFELYSNRGIAHAMRGEHELAIRDFAEAVRGSPGSFELRMNLIFALSDAGRFVDTLSHYEAVVAMRPPTADLCNAYGVALANTGRIEEGLAWLRRAVGLEPDLREAVENLRAVEAAASQQP